MSGLPPSATPVASATQGQAPGQTYQGTAPPWQQFLNYFQQLDIAVNAIVSALSPKVPVSVAASPASPAGTTSTQPVMTGLGISLTPKSSGTVLIIVGGSASNDTSSDGYSVQIRYGTGSAPGNGAVLAGRPAGSVAQQNSVSGGSQNGFTLIGLVVGLAAGVSIWIDLSLAAVTAGTASLSQLSIAAVEIG